MENPIMFEPYQAAKDIYTIPSYFPIPGYGILPVNAFVLNAAEPVLVDAGLVPLSDEFIKKLSLIINPTNIKWLWLTHADMDHVGSLHRILEMAPRIRIITTFFACGRMSLFQILPMDRVHFLNPGQSINVGDRTLKAIKPPSFDAAETTGFYDKKASAFFCADCFGALMSEPTEFTNCLDIEQLTKGMVTWATMDAPWLHIVDRDLFAQKINLIRDLSPKLILIAHLPVAVDIADNLLDTLLTVPDAKPFVGPDQQELEMMLEGMAGK